MIYEVTNKLDNVLYRTIEEAPIHDWTNINAKIKQLPNKVFVMLGKVAKKTFDEKGLTITGPDLPDLDVYYIFVLKQDNIYIPYRMVYSSKNVIEVR